nr:carboxypeptidase regulatory-like domain-containing protein [Acidobacteriota bacterium]
MLCRKRRNAALFLFCVLCAVLLSAAQVSNVSAQGGVNYSGNGGRHTIQGSIFFPSGRRTDMTGLKIKLENWNSGELITFADANGKFTFKNLTAGSYYVLIEASDYYERMREPAYIDAPGGSNSRGSIASNTPRIMNVPIYLQPKRANGENSETGIVNAKLA